MVVTSVSVDDVVVVIDCCELVVELGLVVEREPEVEVEPDCVLVPACDVDDVSDGEVIGGVATLPEVPPDGVPLLVLGEIEVELDDPLVDVSSELAPEAEPLKVPEALVVPLRDDVSVPEADC